MDNTDGCAPALNKVGPNAKSLLVIFIDDEAENRRRVKNLEATQPDFFALNDGFRLPKTAMQLREFMAGRYRNPSVWEATDTPSTKQPLFESLMKLPLVLLFNDREVLCPLIRSLQLALPYHTGSIFALQIEHGALPPSIDINQDTQSDGSVRLVTTCQYLPDVVTVTSLPSQYAESSVVELLLSQSALPLWPAQKTVPVFHGCSTVSVMSIDVRRRQNPSPLRVLGQTLGMEDFVCDPMTGRLEGNNVMRLDNEKINWIRGVSQHHLLQTFPLPNAVYEETERLLNFTVRG